MPVFTPTTVKTDVGDGVDDPCGPYSAQLFSDSGGLTQFGAFVEILPPGSASSVEHWHAGEDEMIYVIAGEVTLVEGDDVTLLHPGDGATFKAGVPVGHCLRNDSEAEVRYLVIGTRSDGDTVTYPDRDRILRWTGRGEARERVWTDHAGNPATSPYTT